MGTETDGTAVATTTVRITRRYVSARTGEMVDATTADAWQALTARVDALSPVAVAEYADEYGEGVDVTVAERRGPRGAFALHDLACRYGALPVIRN